MASSSTSRKGVSKEMSSMGSPLIPRNIPRSDDKTPVDNEQEGVEENPTTTETAIQTPTETVDQANIQGRVEGEGSARGFHNQDTWKFLRELIATDAKFVCDKLGTWFTKLEDEESWLENIRGYLGTLAGLITTMSFAAGLAPPGGVVSASIADTIDDAKRGIAQLTNNAPAMLPGGEAVLAFIDPGEYHQFLIWNSTAMYCSLVTLLLMLSGIPLKHRLMILFVSALMCLDVFAVGQLFSAIVSLTTPRHGGVWARDATTRNVLIYIWLGSLAVVVGVLTLRSVYWCVVRYSKRTIGGVARSGVVEAEVARSGVTEAEVEGTELAATRVSKTEVVVGTTEHAEEVEAGRAENV